MASDRERNIQKKLKVGHKEHFYKMGAEEEKNKNYLDTRGGGATVYSTVRKVSVEYKTKKSNQTDHIKSNGKSISSHHHHIRNNNIIWIKKLRGHCQQPKPFI